MTRITPLIEDDSKNWSVVKHWMIKTNSKASINPRIKSMLKHSYLNLSHPKPGITGHETDTAAAWKVSHDTFVWGLICKKDVSISGVESIRMKTIWLCTCLNIYILYRHWLLNKIYICTSDLQQCLPKMGKKISQVCIFLLLGL